jgi:hypothetical protein
LQYMVLSGKRKKKDKSYSFSIWLQDMTDSKAKQDGRSLRSYMPTYQVAAPLYLYLPGLPGPGVYL